MTTSSTQVRVNLGWTIVLTAVLAIGAFLRWGPGFDDRYQVVVSVPAAGGVQAGMPVTVLGSQVGVIAATDVTREAVDLVLEFEHDQPVPRDVLVQVLRRSPIGEPAVELTPVRADWDPPERIVPSRAPIDRSWTAATPDSRLDPIAVVLPSSVPTVLERAADLLTAVPGPELATVVDELGTALEGRVEVVRQLNDDTAELTETLVTAIPDAERLLEASDEVLGSLAAHREQLATAIGDTADVLETLAAARPDLERTLDAAPEALTTLDTLVRDQRPNLVCLDRDLVALGEVLAAPDGLTHLERILDLNRFFYGGFDAATQWDPYRPGVIWARVNILIDRAGTGQQKIPLTPTPATRPGAACTSPFGPGVQAVRQTDPPPLPPDETAPGIDYAPLVAGADAGGRDGVPERDAGASDRDVRAAPAPARAGDRELPATGGGAALVAVWLVTTGVVLRGRR